MLLLLLLLCMPLASLSSFSSPVTTASLSGIDYQAVSVTTTVSQGLYWQSNCGAEPVSYAECTSPGEGTLTQPFCISGDEQRYTSPVANTNLAYYQGTIENFLTCTSSVVISVELDYGVSSVVVTIGDWSKTIYSSDNPSAGVVPVSLCCSDLFALANVTSVWDGTFWVEISSLTPAALTLLVPQNTSSLPVSKYYQLVPSQLTCNGVDVSCSSGCPINVATTVDPVYTYWTTILKSVLGAVNIVSLPGDENSISTLVWSTKLDPNSLVNSGLFGAGEERVLDSGEPRSFDFDNCYISYYQVVDINGNSLSLQTSKETKGEEQCIYADYLPYYDAFANLVSYLQFSSSGLSSDQIYSIIDMAEAIAASRAWQNCLDLANSFLLENKTNLTIPTKDCLTVDSDPYYNFDPCCNTTLQLNQCCRTSNFSYPATAYTLPPEVDPLTDFGQCSTPNCLLQPLQNLQAISGYTTRDSCSDERVEAENDPKFLANPFTMCVSRVYGITCFFDNVCKSISSDSICDPQIQQCVIHCNEDGSCYNGACNTTLNRCLDPVSDIIVQTEAVLKCALDNIDPYLAILVNNEIESSEGQTLAQQFLGLVTEDSCTTKNGVPIANGELNEEQCNEYLGVCKVLAGAIGITLTGADLSGKPPLLTAEFCKRTVLYQDAGYCAYVINDFVAVPMSRPDVCQMRLEDAGNPQVQYSELVCLALYRGTTWISADQLGWRPFGACIDLNITTELECTQEPPCLGVQYKNVPCHSYCTDHTITDPALCVQTNASLPTMAWYWYPGLTGIAGVCVIESDLFTCAANPAETYWIGGRDWLPARYNTPDTCPGQMCFGYLDGSGFLDTPIDECVQYGCATCKTGTEPQCASEAACNQVDGCDNVVGCVLPTNIYELSGVNVPCNWDPKECITAYDRTVCSNGGFPWYDALSFPTEKQCVDALQICNDGTVPDGSYRNWASLPTGYNLRNETECTACGGHIEQWWNWGPSKWVSNNVVIGPSWQTTVIEEAVWGPTLSANRFSQLLERARVKRLTSILAAELYCLYGIESDLLKYVGCACTDLGGNTTLEEDCYDKLTSLSGSPISVVSVCSGIPVNKSVYESASIVTDNFDIDGSVPCVTLSVDVIPLEQFSFVSKGLTTSLALVSETQTARLSSTYVYNQNDVAVGNIVSDGFSIHRTENVTFTGILLCIQLPNPQNVSWELHDDLYVWDIATSTPPDFEFEPVGLNLPLDSKQACIEIKMDEDLVYFPIGLRQDWESVTIEQTWTSEEKGLMIFCVVMFLILFIWVTWSFVMRIATGGCRKFPRPEAVLLSLMVLSGLGAAYQIGTITGAYQEGNLTPLFTDLPQLCLLTCIVLTSSAWATVVSMGDMSGNKETLYERLIPFLFLSSLYLIFIALSIASAAVDSVQNFNCATSEADKDAMTPSQALSTSYKAIFAFYTFVIALSFLYSGLKVIHMLHDVENEQFRDILWKSMIATTVATLALFVTVAISLYSVVYTLSNTTKLAFTITVLILPGYALAYLFNYKSEFTSKFGVSALATFGKKSTASTRPKSKSTDKSSSKAVQ